MPIPEPDHDISDQFHTRVDDELYNELSALEGERIEYTAVWEESVVDALADAAPTETLPGAADIDLYLACGVYFELFGVYCYTGLDDPPLDDLDRIEEKLTGLVKAGATLGEIAVDDEDALILVLLHDAQPALYLHVGAWILAEWEELPDPLES
jgi:hypothetical protein